jgi:phosphoribosylglycinamide formyltransferase-1
VLSALRPLEHELLPRAVSLIAQGALRLDPEEPRRTVVEHPASPAGEG